LPGTALNTLLCLIVGLGLAPSAAQANDRGDEGLYTDWQTFGVEEGLPDDRILALHVAGEQVWIGTEKGPARIRGGALTTWTVRDGLPARPVSAIDVDDRTDDVWLGTLGGGVLRYSGGRFDRFDQMNSGLAGNIVFDLEVEAGRVWVATNGGLSRYDTARDTWSLYRDRRLDRPETLFTSLGVLGDELYAAAWLAGLESFDLTHDPAIQGVPTAPRIVPYSPTAGDTLLAATTERALWVVTSTHLHSSVESGPWRRHAIPGGPPGLGTVRCFAPGRDGGAWLGTYDGIRSLVDADSDTWITYRRASAGDEGIATVYRSGEKTASRRLASIFPDNRIRAIARGADGLWVGTASGLALGTRSAGTPLSLETAGKLASPAREDDRGRALRIAQFGSDNRSIPLAWDLPRPRPPRHKGDLLTAERAVARVNESLSGEDSLLMVNRPSEFANYGWSQPEDRFVDHVYEQEIRGGFGYLAPGRLISTGVVLLAEVPLVNISPDPPSEAERHNPWIFRCPIHDRSDQSRVVDHVIDVMGCRRFAVVRTEAPLTDLHLEWWTQHALERGVPTVADLVYDPDDVANLSRLLGQLADSRADAVITWSNLEDSTTFLRGLREAGMTQVFVGSDSVVRDEFLARAGENPGRVVAPYPCAHRQDDEGVAELIHASPRYPSRTEIHASPRYPSRTEFLTYDAALHLADAVLAGGASREALRDSLRRTSEIELAVIAA